MAAQSESMGDAVRPELRLVLAVTAITLRSSTTVRPQAGMAKKWIETLASRSHFFGPSGSPVSGRQTYIVGGRGRTL